MDGHVGHSKGNGFHSFLCADAVCCILENDSLLVGFTS